MEKIYCIKLITFELNILYILVLIRPDAAENITVNSSGTDVANPAIFPDAFGPSSNNCDILLKTGTNKYFDNATIPNYNMINLTNSINKFINSSSILSTMFIRLL